MWKPKYIIRNKLLSTIRQIGETLGTINASQLSPGTLTRLAIQAQAISTFASTSIEGNPLPLTDVKRLIKRAPTQIRDTEREVLNYNRALEWVNQAVTNDSFEVSTKTFEKIQGMVVDGLMDNPFDVGKFRKKPVVIRDPRQLDNVMFIPPNHQDVPQLCNELMAFVNENLDDIDPVLLSGLFHKQAVIIHPFMDGNGRSTRLMTTAILGKTGLDIFQIFSFEAYYNRNVSRYFQMVGEQGDYYDLKSESDFTSWLEYYAEGTLDELKRVQKTLPERSIRLEPHHTTILGYIDEHGSITQKEYGNISNRSLASRKKDFTKLIEFGLIRSQGGGRSVYYIKA